MARPSAANRNPNGPRGLTREPSYLRKRKLTTAGSMCNNVIPLKK